MHSIIVYPRCTRSSSTQWVVVITECLIKWFFCHVWFPCIQNSSESATSVFLLLDSNYNGSKTFTLNFYKKYQLCFLILILKSVISQRKPSCGKTSKVTSNLFEGESLPFNQERDLSLKTQLLKVTLVEGLQLSCMAKFIQK